MSEPIQSIANGTYMIGETTQTELQAGPGISITKPSEGTVRIANDETVLWENSSGSTSSVALSESPYNFRFVDIYAGIRGSNATTGPSVYRLSPIINSSLYCITVGYVYNNNPFDAVIKLTLSSTSISSQANNNGAALLTFKVVGINRISGGNT